jgi:hypothetical protein
MIIKFVLGVEEGVFEKGKGVVVGKTVFLDDSSDFIDGILACNVHWGKKKPRDLAG